MIIQHGLPFIRDDVSELNAALKQQAPQHQLTRLQCYWLSFVILGVLVTNSLCWMGFLLKVHCVRDKQHGGFFRGQEIVFLVLITKELTIPVGFELYEPDPKVRVWRKERESLKSALILSKSELLLPIVYIVQRNFLKVASRQHISLR